jgi:hypothetical protein
MDICFVMDVPPPNPVAPVTGAFGVSVLVLIVLGLGATMIAGFVYLLIRINRRRRRANEIASGERDSSGSSSE